RLVAQIMGVKERRDRERLEMRQAILDSAREIAAKEGWQAVTIRRVAEKIEYSPPAIYEYFESKEALLEEEAREAFGIFLADLIAARDAHTDPRERLRAMGDAYWNFVWKHPELYQVISGLGGVNLCEPGHEHPHSEGNQVFETFRDVLQANLPAAGRAADDIEGRVMILWSLYHGFIALLMTGRIPMESRDRARALAGQAVDGLLTAWRAGRG
ncbi:MAG TPA: TetR/AcrR family transcriptional regulator, partial [bacterium]|nr:TetR/AcrR family transcriptional regulator [bacterium]